MLSSNRQERSPACPVDGRTRLLGVFGFPVEHSLSPVMHNAAIAALGLPYVYVPFCVQPDEIGEAIRSLIPLRIVGVNLTIPHKENVLPYLDEISAEARAVGAVNTVHNLNGRLIGHITDGYGFSAPLREAGFEPHNRSAVVLGAGGAARSVVFSLVAQGARVTLINRSLDRAQALAQAVISHNSSANIEVMRYEDDGVGAAIRAADLVVNTTSVGMSPHEDAIPPIPLDALQPDQLVYDLIYNPVQTRLLAAAKSVGAKTLNGAAMLAYQGAAAFEIWTGHKPPIDVMLAAIQAHL